MRFTRHRSTGGVKADVDAFEAGILTQLAEQLLGLIEPAHSDSDDPLAALVGLPSGDVERPDDPVLQRLLPDAYADDSDAAGEFRRYTDSELRTTKRAHAQAVLASVPEDGGKLRLDRDQCDAWLGALNDMRLALGTVLGVTEELDPDEVDHDDPSYQALQIYGWLGWLQESLLSCLEPRLP